MTTESGPMSAAYLNITDEWGRTSRQDIPAGPSIIGRSAEAGVRLTSETVSRRHAEISREAPGRWRLRDLGSNNGTRVNGRRISEVVLLPDDRVEIGQYELRVVDPDAPETGAATTIAVMDETDGRISTLGEVVSPKIDTTHVAMINQVARQMNAIEDAAERMKTLCALMVRPEFHGQAALALRLVKADPDRPPRLLCDAQISQSAATREPHVSGSLLRVVRRTETPALAAHTLSSDQGVVRMTMISGQEDTAAVACPLRSTAEALDVLYVTLPLPYGTGEWLTLIAHAAQTYDQIETAREAQREREAKAAMDRDLSRAAEIQRNLVPESPTMPGLEIAIGFDPCRSVGGDYVDVVRWSDGRTLLAIADVCGKGMPAAMVASTVHSMVHACQRAKINLPDMMSALNEHLCEYLDDRAFVTMVCMIIDPAGGTFEIVNAGHPAPAVIAPDGGVRHLQEAQNYPLGILPFEVEAVEGVLDSGHVLALFTDGLTELTDSEDRELGPERVVAHIGEILAPAKGGTVELAEVAERLKQVLSDYLGTRLPLDDRTFLLARRD